MKFGYIRVSTADQNSDLQTDQLNQEGYDQIVHETASGAKNATMHNKPFDPILPAFVPHSSKTG